MASVLNFRRPSGGRGQRHKLEENEQIEERDEYDEYAEDEYDEADDYAEGDDYEEEGSDADETDGEEKTPVISPKRFIRSILRIIAIGCALGVLITLILASGDKRNYTAAEFRASIPVHTISTTKYMNFDGIILGISKDGASGMDTKGNVLWQISYEMQRPITDMRGNVLAIGDYGGGRIFLLDSKEGQIGTVNTNLPIRALSVSQKGYVAAVLGDTEATWIYVFDKAGETIAYIKRAMSVSGYPVSVSLSPSGKLLACAQTAADNMSIKTSVAFYNFGSVGKNSVDNCVSGYNYVNEIVPYVHFMSDTSCISASDLRLSFFEGAEVPTDALDVMFQEELSGIWAGEQYCALLFPDSTGEETYSLSIFTSAGTKVGQIDFTMEFTDIILRGDRVIIHDGQRALIYSVQGEKRFEGSFGKPVLAVIPTEGASRYYLLEEESIEEMVLR